MFRDIQSKVTNAIRTQFLYQCQATLLFQAVDQYFGPFLYAALGYGLAYTGISSRY